MRGVNPSSTLAFAVQLLPKPFQSSLAVFIAMPFRQLSGENEGREDMQVSFIVYI